MFSRVMVGADDVAASKKFSDAALGECHEAILNIMLSWHTHG